LPEKTAFRYVALCSNKTSYFITTLVEAGYLKEHYAFSQSTAQAIEALRLDVGDNYTFSRICARLTKALKRDEANITANGIPDSSVWEGIKTDYQTFSIS
jgi:hypothetical protein